MKACECVSVCVQGSGPEKPKLVLYSIEKQTIHEYSYIGQYSYVTEIEWNHV